MELKNAKKAWNGPNILFPARPERGPSHSGLDQARALHNFCKTLILVAHAVYDPFPMSGHIFKAFYITWKLNGRIFDKTNFPGKHVSRRFRGRYHSGIYFGILKIFNFSIRMRTRYFSKGQMLGNNFIIKKAKARDADFGPAHSVLCGRALYVTCAYIKNELALPPEELLIAGYFLIRFFRRCSHTTRVCSIVGQLNISKT